MRRSGTRIRVEFLDVRAMLSTLPHARVGFVVPKYGHSSVDRNRLKRRLRELVRTQLLPLLRPPAGGTVAHVTPLPPIDVVVRALPTAYGATFSALAAEVGRVRDGVRDRVAHSAN